MIECFKESKLDDTLVFVKKGAHVSKRFVTGESAAFCSNFGFDNPTKVAQKASFVDFEAELEEA